MFLFSEKYLFLPLGVTMVRLSLLAETKTSAGRFCNKDYSLIYSYVGLLVSP